MPKKLKHPKYKEGEIVYVKCLYIIKTKINIVLEDSNGNFWYEITYDNGVTSEYEEEDLKKTKLGILVHEHLRLWRRFLGFPFDDHFKYEWISLIRDVTRKPKIAPTLKQENYADKT